MQRTVKFNIKKLVIYSLTHWTQRLSRVMSIKKNNNERFLKTFYLCVHVWFNSRCRTFILVCSQPPRSIQPDHPLVGRRNEYQPKGGDAGKYRRIWFVCGWQVKLCDPLVTRETSERFRDKHYNYHLLYLVYSLSVSTLVY